MRPRAFVGREDELARLGGLVDTGRPLVTVTGPPGIGKTALAASFVHRWRVATEGDHEVGFCELTEAGDVEGACAAVAAAVGAVLGGEPGPAALARRVGEVLAERGPSLLVLDDFDRLVAHAPLLGDWLQAAPELQLVVTSRERLRLPSEVVLELSPLAVPDAGAAGRESEAVRLWEARRAELEPGYRLGDPELPAVVEIVRRLEGVPLAIELAVARTPVLDPEQLLARLRDRLDALDRHGSAADRGQRTLRSAIDWSWALLSEEERSALAQCSVFRGGFELRDAEEVVDLGERPTAEVIDVIQSLRDKSLLRARREQTGLRLDMYMAVRQYAAAHLGEVASPRRVTSRHARWLATRSAALAARSDGPEARRALAELEACRDNLLAAVESSLEGQPDPKAVERALGILAAMEPLVRARGPLVPHLERLDRALALAGEGVSSAAVGRARVLRGSFAARARSVDQGLGDLECAIAAAGDAGDVELEVRALRELSGVRVLRGEIHESVRTAEHALDRARAAGRASLEGPACYTLAAILGEAGRLDESVSCYERALSLLESAEDRRHEAAVLAELGSKHLDRGDLDAARGYAERAAERNGAVGNAMLHTYVLLLQGAIAHTAGDPSTARDRYDEARANAERLGDRRFASAASAYAAMTQCELGELTEGRLRLREALSRYREAGDRRYPWLFQAFLAAMEATAGQLASARDEMDEAERGLESLQEETLLTAVRVHRGHLDLAEAREAEARGDVEAAEQARAAARDRVRAHEADGRGSSRSAELRQAVRLLERAIAVGLEGRVREERVLRLVVHEDAEWFVPPSGRAVLCRRRHVIRRLLGRLVQARTQRPGEPVSAAELRAAGWPRERILPDAARNRLHVSLSRLRELGLRAVLRAVDDGWLIDPDVEVEVSRAREPPA